MLFGAKRKGARKGKGKRSSKKKAAPVKGPASFVLATVPPRPKGYLTYQKGTKIIAKKLSRKGGKKGRKVCR